MTAFCSPILMRFLIGLSMYPTRYGWNHATAGYHGSFNRYIYHIPLIIKWHLEKPTEIIKIHFFKILIFFNDQNNRILFRQV